MNDIIPNGIDQNVFCGSRGTPLDEPANLPVTNRAPCRSCRSTSRRIEVTCTGNLNLAGALSTELTPGAQARDWRQRWAEIQQHLTRLSALHSEPLSAKSIQNANHDLQSFFVQTYHLKDSLIQDSGTTGISSSTIESAIKGNPHLALLADLANLDKHGRLTRPPRSGDVPVLRKLSGVSDSAMGWRLSLEIYHKGKTLDGLSVASETVSAWQKQLRQWGLI